MRALSTLVLSLLCLGAGAGTASAQSAGFYGTTDGGIAAYYNGVGAYCIYPTLRVLRIDWPDATYDAVQRLPPIYEDRDDYRYDGFCRDDPDFVVRVPSDLFLLDDGTTVVRYLGSHRWCSFRSMNHLKHYWNLANVTDILELPELDTSRLIFDGACRH
jgi:hypothetical protein